MLEVKTNFKRLHIHIFLRGLIAVICLFAGMFLLLDKGIQTSSIILTLGDLLMVGCLIGLGLLNLKDLIPLIILAFKKTNVICSFSENGFTDYRTNKEYYWDDLERIRSASIDARILIIKLKDNLGRIYLDEICVSNENYKQMILHIKKYAPKNITQGVSVPVYYDKFELILTSVKVGFVLAIVFVVYIISLNI